MIWRDSSGCYNFMGLNYRSVINRFAIITNQGTTPYSFNKFINVETFFENLRVEIDLVTFSLVIAIEKVAFCSGHVEKLSVEITSLSTSWAREPISLIFLYSRPTDFSDIFVGLSYRKTVSVPSWWILNDVVPDKPVDGFTVIEIDSSEAKHGVKNKRTTKMEIITFIIFPLNLTSKKKKSLFSNPTLAQSAHLEGPQIYK